MKILITGGAGFIGSHVADAYVQAGHQVMVLDDLSGGKKQNITSVDGNPSLREVDIRDTQALRKLMAEFQPDVINHHAAQVSVVVSAEDPLRDLDLNIKGTVSLLEAARLECPQAKVIYASSGGAMYGSGQLPYNEETTAQPTSPYGLSKHTAERYVWLYRSLYNLNATVLRYSNVYGPRQDPHGEAGVCAIFTQRMLEGKPVTIFGDGSATRDYVYVGDVALANVAALDKGEGEAFNISTGTPTSTKAIFEALRKALSYSLEPQQAPLRAGEVTEVYLSPTKAEQILGWRAQVSLEDGIKQTVASYQS